MKQLAEKVKRRLRWYVGKLTVPEAPRRVVHSRVNGYQLLVLANEDVGRAIHFLGRYELNETDYFSLAIKEDDICFDVGGNVGYFSMLMADKARKGAVHVFEPIKLNASLLDASVALNQFTNVTVNQCAVGARTGTVNFAQSADSAYSSMEDTHCKPLDRNVTVPLTTLDAYMSEHGVPRIDVMKVDVEGAEFEVIKGAAGVFESPDRPRVVMLELYGKWLERFNATVHDVLTAMRGYGYQPFYTTSQGQLSQFMAEHIDQFCNVIFVRT